MLGLSTEAISLALSIFFGILSLLVATLNLWVAYKGRMDRVEKPEELERLEGLQYSVFRSVASKTSRGSTLNYTPLRMPSYVYGVGWQQPRMDPGSYHDATCVC
ncbi:hypothetical protein CGCFRS4_v012224 [Colletotrichum fructicola]|nr:hypothetical protein CGCFRS4_v012224 [Colletotrichum fructicola]